MHVGACSSEVMAIIIVMPIRIIGIIIRTRIIFIITLCIAVFIAIYDYGYS